MKRLLLLGALIICAYSLSFAQESDKHNFEGGVSESIYPNVADGANTHYQGYGLYFEYRYNLIDHIDLGGKVYYQYSTGRSVFTGDMLSVFPITYNQIGVKGFADLNILPGKKVCPFVGFSLGIADVAESYKGNTYHEFRGTISPRIGVEVWRIRIATELDYGYDPGYGIKHERTLTLNVGFVF